MVQNFLIDLGFLVKTEKNSAIIFVKLYIAVYKVNNKVI